MTLIFLSDPWSQHSLFVSCHSFLFCLKNCVNFREMLVAVYTASQNLRLTCLCDWYLHLLLGVQQLLARRFRMWLCYPVILSSTAEMQPINLAIFQFHWLCQEFGICYLNCFLFGCSVNSFSHKLLYKILVYLFVRCTEITILLYPTPRSSVNTYHCFENNNSEHGLCFLDRAFSIMKTKNKPTKCKN